MIKIVNNTDDLVGINPTQLWSIFAVTREGMSKIVAVTSTSREAEDAVEMLQDLKSDDAYSIRSPRRLSN
jgi:hypothetical protein